MWIGESTSEPYFYLESLTCFMRTFHNSLTEQKHESKEAKQQMTNYHEAMKRIERSAPNRAGRK